MKKKLLITLPTLLHGVSTQCVDAWSLYTMCRDPLQKDRGRSDVFFEGCVCGNGRRGGDVVLVVVVVVDVYMGWVKKKL